jgi:hypothetical protein
MAGMDGIESAPKNTREPGAGFMHYSFMHSPGISLVFALGLHSDSHWYSHPDSKGSLFSQQDSAHVGQNLHKV